MSYVCFSCSSGDKTKGPIGDGQIEFGATISKRATTKSSKNEWGSDEIGVFMLNARQALSVESLLEGNKRYVTSGTSGIFKPYSQSEALYFPTSGGDVNFVAYYPYSASVVGFKYPVDISVQDDIAKLDLLYSNNKIPYSNKSTTVGLGFKHALANVVFNITTSDGSELDGLKVTIQGFKTRSEFLLVDGTFKDVEGSVADIVANTVVSGATAKSEALILPIENVASAKVRFEVQGQNRTYVWNIPAGQKFVGGNRYTYIINFNEEELVVVNPGGSIDDWVDNNDDTPIELDPQAPSTSDGDGTFANPLSVEELSLHVGEQGKWIKGWLVGTAAVTRSASGVFEPPFTYKNNVLVASSSAESDLSKCVEVILNGAGEFQQKLNLVDNSHLLKTEILVEGSVVKNGDGSISVAQLTGVYMVGDEPNPNPERVRFFYEDFGNGNHTSWKNQPTVAEFDGWKMKTPIKYSDEYGASVLSGFTTSNACLHFVPNNKGQLKIENIPANYTNIILTLDMSAQRVGTAAERITIICNGKENSKQLEGILGVNKNFVSFSLPIPNNTTEIEICNLNESDGSYYIDNIELFGVAK